MITFIPELSFFLGKFKITPLFWAIVLAGFFSSFLCWRKLKEDYPQEEIYRLLLVIFIFVISFWVIGRNFGIGLLAGFAGMVASVFWWAASIKKNPWEVLDSLSLPLINFLIFGGVGLFLTRKDLWELRYFVLGMIIFGIYLFMKKRYRSFSWYKSGKTGFLFWSTTFLSFLSLYLLAFFKNVSLYWQSISYLVVAVLSLGVIYWRSERKLSDDFKFLKKRD